MSCDLSFPLGFPPKEIAFLSFLAIDSATMSTSLIMNLRYSGCCCEGLPAAVATPQKARKNVTPMSPAPRDEAKGSKVRSKPATPLKNATPVKSPPKPRRPKSAVLSVWFRFKTPKSKNLQKRASDQMTQCKLRLSRPMTLYCI